MASGAQEEKGPLLTSVFSTLLPLPTDILQFLPSIRHIEEERRRQYSQRICEVEHGTFSPLVFSSTGGMARKSTVFNKRLASLLSERWEQPYSVTMGWLWCTLCFCLLPSAIQYLGKPDHPEVDQSFVFPWT